MDLSEKELLEKIEAKIHAENLCGQWEFEARQQAALDGPPPISKPHVWRWDLIDENLQNLKAAIPESMNIRRNISFIAPGLRGGTTQSMVMGVQMIKPGETAWSHRHLADALRFVVHGDPDLHTVVDGEVCPMEDYDLIRTPGNCWHDHTNHSDHEVTWVDIVDSPVIVAMNQQFYEDLGEDRQTPRNEPAGASRGDFRIAAGNGASGADATPPPSYRYSWTEARARLSDLAEIEGDPCDGVAIEYVNRETGGATFNRMTCWAQMLRAGEMTKAHRHTYSSVYFVVDGEGRSIINGEEITWKKHDSFVVPNWTWHEHHNLSKSGEALLFATHDIPLVRALGTYREEVRS